MMNKCHIYYCMLHTFIVAVCVLLNSKFSILFLTQIHSDWFYIPKMSNNALLRVKPLLVMTLLMSSRCI